MKRGFLATIIICATSVPLMADLVDSVHVGDLVRFIDREGTTDTGGEFALAAAGATYNPALPRTFCMQMDEKMDFDPAGFKVVGISTFVEPQHDPLDERTAYLYTKFRQGTLSNYVYTLGGAPGGTYDHVDSANDLQAAIWAIQGDLPMPVGGQALAWITEAANEITLGHWSGMGNVRVLNLVWATARYGNEVGSPSQDVLVLVPAPGAPLLLCIGLSLLASLKRRFA